MVNTNISKLALLNKVVKQFAISKVLRDFLRSTYFLNFIVPSHIIFDYSILNSTRVVQISSTLELLLPNIIPYNWNVYRYANGGTVEFTRIPIGSNSLQNIKYHNLWDYCLCIIYCCIRFSTKPTSVRTSWKFFQGRYLHFFLKKNLRDLRKLNSISKCPHPSGSTIFLSKQSM